MNKKSGHRGVRSFCCAADGCQRQDFLLIRMGITMITAITPPMMTIWSVDPTMDLSCAGGEGGTCMKNAPLVKSVFSAPEGAEYVNAALKSASKILNPIVMRGGVNLFMSLATGNLGVDALLCRDCR